MGMKRTPRVLRLLEEWPAISWPTIYRPANWRVGAGIPEEGVEMDVTRPTSEAGTPEGLTPDARVPGEEVTGTAPRHGHPERAPWDYREWIGCRLLHVSREHRALLGELLEEAGLYPGQEQLLFELLEHGPRTQAELAAALKIDTSTVSKMLHRLERGGFITRTRREDNRRMVIVTTTDRSEALRHRIRQVLSRVEQRITRGLTKEESATLLDLLRRVEDNLRGDAGA